MSFSANNPDPICSFCVGDIPGTGADSGLPSYQSPRPSQNGAAGAGTSGGRGSSGGSNSKQSMTRPSGVGQSPNPSFGTGSGGSNSRQNSFGSFGLQPGGGRRPGDSVSRPASPGSSLFGVSTRTNLGGGSGSSFGGSSSGGSSSSEEANNFGFPERLGRAGIDFPIYDRMNMPQTSFTCQDKENGG